MSTRRFINQCLFNNDSVWISWESRIFYPQAFPLTSQRGTPSGPIGQEYPGFPYKEKTHSV